MTLQRALRVADAVLYEGYLLYPYRATSGKNHSRWQFGVLGPPGAAEAGIGEDARMSTELLVRNPTGGAAMIVRLRCLQLESRLVSRLVPDGYEHVEELISGEQRWLTWDEAVEQQPTPFTGPVDTQSVRRVDVELPAHEEFETLCEPGGAEVGLLRRVRCAVHARLSVRTERVTGTDLVRLAIDVQNTTPDAMADPAAAIAGSLIGAHLVLEVEGGEFLSMTDPPPDATAAAAGCAQHRCWPVLAGPEGDSSLMLVSPIILADHPEVAEQSPGALFDATEIDEILTLRVMTMTDEEKVIARATDPRAAEIVDRCDAMSPEAMLDLHGVLRNPHALDPAGDVDLSSSFGFDGEVPWWDPAVDGSVDPKTDAVEVRGVRVAAGSTVRLHPNRRADAQDIFFAEQLARVTAVHSDVDGDIHVAVVLLDDPAADLHDWYGRYLYFAPDEVEPITDGASNREESRS